MSILTNIFVKIRIIPNGIHIEKFISNPSYNLYYFQTGFGSRALDPQGKPVGREDPNQLRGMSPEHAAERIVTDLERRNTELILAPFHIRLAILLRVIAPNLLWWLLRRKALAEKKRGDWKKGRMKSQWRRKYWIARKDAGDEESATLARYTFQLWCFEK